MLSKLPQFVEWPVDALAGRQSVDLCVSQPDPFGPDLDDLVAGETLNGKLLAARRVDQEIDGCHVLFLPAHSGRDTRPLLQKAASLPVLTVGDDERFMEDGGIVRLRMVDGRVRFDINATAANRAGLRISSQLLQLALTVRGGGQ